MARDIDSLLRQQAALAIFGSFAFQEDDLMKILSEAARICAESLGVQFCKVCRYREAENDLLVEAGYGWKDGVVGEVISRADESSPQGRAFVTGEPVIVRNLTESNGYIPPPFYAQHGIVSTADVLIKARSGPPFGVLEIDSSQQHTYDEHDINFLTGFANVLAEAVATRNRNLLLRETLENMQVLVREKVRLLEQRDVLARELQHRVRNNLQLVNGMLNEQLKLTAGESEQRALRGIIRRVMTLATVYDHLLGAGMGSNLDFGAYARLLCENLPELQPKAPFPVSLVCQSDELTLDLTAATALGLVIAELVSNSYEHAFDERGGSIVVSVRHDGQPDRGVVRITDDGSGYVPDPETRRHGVGLARRLMQQIGGTLEVATARGTAWTMRFPIGDATPQVAA
nr:histidine kinase dimerization/phosphoacceptor domain -containing protein [uncultured Rhodopila sp.]